MIDERQEELASLYVLDLLEGAERAKFEQALGQNPHLQALVRELNDASSALVHTVPPTPPPPELKSRVMASITRDRPAEDVSQNIIHPPAFSRWRMIVPWAAAACFAVTAAWLAPRLMMSRSEALLLRDQNRLLELTLKGTRQHLEAERIINRQQIQTLDQQLAGTTQQLADTRIQLAGSRSRIGERDRQVATLTQRIEALAGDSADISRQLGEARERIAKLTNDLKAQGDLANLKITALASMLDNSPQALAVAVWDPTKQEGVLTFDKLPALAPGKEYQLWVVDPQYPNPVDGGVFKVDPETGKGRLQFKAKQPVESIAAFAVTLERTGGVTKAEGPFVLLGK